MKVIGQSNRIGDRDMEKHITFKTGLYQYFLPVSVIIKDRVEHYKGKFGSIEEAIKDTTELFDSDNFEIIDWFQNSMDLEDYKGSLLKVALPENEDEEIKKITVTNKVEVVKI